LLHTSRVSQEKSTLPPSDPERALEEGKMKQYWSWEWAVLVTRATSTGYYHRPVLVRSV